MTTPSHTGLYNTIVITAPAQLSLTLILPRKLGRGLGTRLFYFTISPAHNLQWAYNQHGWPYVTIATVIHYFYPFLLVIHKVENGEKRTLYHLHVLLSTQLKGKNRPGNEATQFWRRGSHTFVVTGCHVKHLFSKIPLCCSTMYAYPLASGITLKYVHFQR